MINKLQEFFTLLQDGLQNIVKSSNDFLWDWIVLLLMVVGIFFTVSTLFVQFRLFPRSVKEMLNGRKDGDDTHGITPFQAFVTGLASRVGVGNIAGVAIAIGSGGPGAVFWMWLTALIGMSAAFAESTLAQLFKERDNQHKIFRGGPAYYITKGLNQRWLGVSFSLSLILAFGFVFNGLQANTIATATQSVWGWNEYYVGVALSLICLPILFGGIKRIAKLAEGLVPLMAVLYLLIALYIIATNFSQVGKVLRLIFTEAFNFDAVAGGIFGAVISKAMMLGIQRGLFSNEAGMGSAPNAAANADVKHPVSQGMIQMLGVFVDTFLVCSCTAFIILLSDVDNASSLKGVEFTQLAIKSHMGNIGTYFLNIVIILFAFTTIMGNYAYAENNVQFLKNNKKVIYLFRIFVILMVFFGSIANVQLVWDMADLSMGIMVLINLTAIVLLSRYVFILLNDYIKQLKAGKEPEFKLSDHPKIAKKIKSDIW